MCLLPVRTRLIFEKWLCRACGIFFASLSIKFLQNVVPILRTCCTVFGSAFPFLWGFIIKWLNFSAVLVERPRRLCGIANSINRVSFKLLNTAYSARCKGDWIFQVYDQHPLGGTVPWPCEYLLPPPGGLVHSGSSQFVSSYDAVAMGRCDRMSTIMVLDYLFYNGMTLCFRVCLRV